MSSYGGCHMYNEEDDSIVRPATDVFEINDFTAATEWENFIDDIENVLRGWQLSRKRSCQEVDRSSFQNANWKSRREKLDFYDFPFWVIHYQLVEEGGNDGSGNLQEDTGGEEKGRDGELDIQESGLGVSDKEADEESQLSVDMLSSSADFTHGGPAGASCWGLREMIVIQPAGEEILGNETRARMVVGAVNIALHNTGCPVACLVQVMEPAKQLYTGTAIVSNARTDFSTVCLNRRPQHCGHLAGLLEMFRNRIHQPLPVEIGPARVSIRLSMRLEDWARHAWTIDPPDLQLYSLSGDTDFIQLSSLPFGCPADPVSGLTLHTTWRDLAEELVTDNDVHSDLEPLEAPEWSVEVSLIDNPDCLLFRHLSAFEALCKDNRSAAELLGELRDEGALDGVHSALDRMGAGQVQAPSISLSPLLRKSTPTGGPLQPALLKLVLDFLFPDSNPASNPYPEALQLPAYATHFYETSSTKTAKTTPPDSLVWRLAVAAACCLQWAGASGVAHLLHEFAMELRYRWETSMYLPGLPLGPPDHSQSLFHQKLQLLNCCIGRRIAREERERRGQEEVIDLTKKNTSHVDPTTEASDSDSDEFYECESEEEKKRRCEVQTDAMEVDKLPWERAEGREARVGELRLLNNSDWLYRPHVQDPPPLTEDQLAEQAEVMMQLGSTEAGAEVRARMQSASLLSDMESFKAANPGCSLADLVRWHSPRDWQEDSGLSGRMKCEGNMWASLWEQARAVPARRQKRLFDDTREAEKVVQWLVGLSPGDAAQLLLPCLVQAAHLRLLEASPDLEEPELRRLHSDMAGLVVRMSHLQCLPEVRHYKGPIASEEFGRRKETSHQAGQLVNLLERRIAQALSLRKKFLYDLSLVEEGEEEERDSVEEMGRFVSSLGKGGEVKVLGASRGPAGRLIQSMFRESEQDEHPRPSGLPPPSVKQFVIRSTACRPLPHSRSVAQRLYCRIAQGEFRLAGAFTGDRQYC